MQVIAGRVPSDDAPFEIKAATAFTSGTAVWTSLVDMRNHAAVSVWFKPTNVGSNTLVTLKAQWPQNTGALSDTSDIQNTDVLITATSDGTFVLKQYQPQLAVGVELVANKGILLTFPKRGSYFRLAVIGNHASGSFGVYAQRLDVV
jgi:hypothetical protein